MEDRFKDAISTGNLDEVKSLLSRGVEINSTDDNGESPLHWSVATDDVKIMGVLLASGAKLDIADPNGDTALHSACFRGASRCIKLLIDAGADYKTKNAYKKTPLELLERHKDIFPQVKKQIEEREREKRAKAKSETRPPSRPTSPFQPPGVTQLNISPPMSPSVSGWRQAGPDESNYKQLRQQIEQLLVQLQEEKRRLFAREEALAAKEKELADREARGQFIMSEAAAKETKATAYLAGIQRDQYELRQRVEAFMVQSLKLPAVNPGEIGFFNKIGEGAFADVYKASYRGTNVAVKWFRDHSPDLPTKSDSDLNDLFLRELHILSELRHPNIVLVLGAVCDGTNRGYLMERCKSDLFTFNRKMTDAKLSQRLRIAGRLARAVLYMHHAGYIHRDLKSLNILVDQSDQPKIIDFGFCAKVQDYEFSYTDHKIVQNSNKGTPAYMAPEMLKNEGYSDRSDVFAFGVILWELLTRRIPWENKDPVQIYAEINAGHRLYIPNDVPAPLEQLLNSCWAETPTDRPPIDIVVAKVKEAKRVAKIMGA